MPVDRTKKRNRKLIILTFCVSNFFVGTFFALLAPFFAAEAKKKGASATVAGVILGIYEVVIILLSPVFGNYLTTIGAKFTFVCGMMVCGCSGMLFGFLDGSPDGTTYIVMCVIVRSVEASGSAAFITASFAILANEFPENVASVFGTLELFSGLGMMAGPPLGGLLYQIGGFRLPFISSGAALIVVGCVAWILLPPQSEDARPVGKSFWSFARNSKVLLLGLLLVVFSISIGFTDIALAIHVQKNYHLSPVLLGVVFLAATGVYGFSAPAWGYIADKKPHWGPVMVAIGTCISSAGLLLMGPAPFLHIPIHPLWLLNISQALMGLGIGSFVVCFQEFFITATRHGYPDTLDTYGMVSGVFNFFFSLGLFLGPIVGGYLNDTLDFEWAAAIISCTGISALALWVVYLLSCRCRVDKTGEKQPLLANSSAE